MHRYTYILSALQLQEYTDVRFRNMIANCLLELPALKSDTSFPHPPAPVLVFGTSPFAHPVVLLQSGVAVFAARLLHEQLLARGLVLIQHALARIDHPWKEEEAAGRKVRTESDDWCSLL